MVEPLSKDEQEEMKALQDERKATGGHMSDSARTRLSQLQNREAELKQEKKDGDKDDNKPEPKTGNFGGVGGGKK
jgi:hypothetical protein